MEKELKVWFDFQRHELKNTVHYNTLHCQAKEIAEKKKIPNFIGSDKWVFGFCQRHNLGSRSITHRGQQDNRPKTDIGKAANEYVDSIPLHTMGLDGDHIFNMDETPCFFDMANDTTLHFKGDKNVDGVDTGNRKSRFTVTLTVSLSGKVVKSQIIFKNLKFVPKNLKLPKGIMVSVSKGGSMNTPLMKEWIRGCYAVRGPYFPNSKSLLIMDHYGSHVKDEIVSFLKKSYGSKVLFVPKKMTFFLQPLDVVVNSAFKAALRREWTAWFQSGKKEYTKKGT